MPKATVDQEARRRAARADRHAARRVLWAESSLSRVKGCGQLGTGEGGSVAIKATGSGTARRAGFSGLAVCGSVWSCSCCSAKIASHRQAQLEAAILAWHAIGGRTMMLTLTMRHRRGQRLKTLWDGLSYAWGKVTSGRAWKREQDAYGIAGWTRVVEATHGDNGWHVHVHALLFVDEAALLPGMSVLDLAPVLFQRWRDALVRKGLDAPIATLGGLDARMVAGDSAAPLGRYFAKQVYGRPDDASGAAWETVGGQGKTAKSGNRTPFQILADLVRLGDADDLDLWHEWERASLDRRQMTWSKGIRSQLLLPEEDLDDQAVAEADDLDGDVLAVIDLPEWRSTWRWHTSRLLDAAESDDTGQLLLALLRDGP